MSVLSDSLDPIVEPRRTFVAGLAVVVNHAMW